MTRFVPTSSRAVAETISANLWSLSRPESVRLPGEVSAFWCDLRSDAAGNWWLRVDTEESIPMHSEAVLNGIADILGNAGVTQAEIDALDALIITSRGQQLTPWQYFPQSFKDASKEEHEITWPVRT
jgi:hypothetical protein